MVRYGLMQYANDINIFVTDQFELEASFDAMALPAIAFGYFISSMILVLSFFMMTISFT